MSHKNLALGDRVVLAMPAELLERYAEVWARRVEDSHLGIVIDLMKGGDVRVWDSIEGDWWCARAKHLKRLP